MFGSSDGDVQMAHIRLLTADVIIPGRERSQDLWMATCGRVLGPAQSNAPGAAGDSSLGETRRSLSDGVPIKTCARIEATLS